MPRLCKYCGKPLNSIAKHKPKTFCNSYCRTKWWNQHRDRARKKAVYHFTCKNCHKHFESYGNRNLQYCSRACYISHRYGGVP